MLIFLDTEYTSPATRDLISIGLVSEDGTRVFYGERSDFNESVCNSFVRREVLPLLGRERLALVELREALRVWFRNLPRRVEIACDSSIDWDLLHVVFEGDFPSNVAGRFDLRSLIDSTVFHQAVCRFHEVAGQPWHHSLHDARAHRAGWLAWMDSRKTRSA